MKAAVIGIGSNSVRMLQAEVRGESWIRLLRDREGTRLFAGLDARGNLSPQSMRRTADAVVRMVENARACGCERVDVFATSASRDATNGAVFLAMLTAETGVLPRIISGEEEAVLSFLGASELAGSSRCGMMDIGGGSTELVIGQGERMEMTQSFQMGAVRLFRRFPISGPEDMVPVEAEAARILEEKLRFCPALEAPECWIGTGGTFTALGAMISGMHWTDRSCLHGTVIPRESARQIGCMLAAMPLAERLKLPGLQPQRADIVVHGICILLAVMSRLDIAEIRVSEYGNLDGYIRKYMLDRSSGIQIGD